MKKNSISLFTDLFDDNFSLFQIKNDLANLKTNIKETDKQYIFEINVAGIKKENIDININEGYLIVSVKDQQEENEKTDNYIRKEIVYKNSKRKYYIGEIKEDNIQASMDNGILTINISKESNNDLKKSIEIK